MRPRAIPAASIISPLIRTSGARFFMHYGDLTDATNLIRIVQQLQPDEIYKLAAQSHVRVSFETLGYTAVCRHSAGRRERRWRMGCN